MEQKMPASTSMSSFLSYLLHQIHNKEISSRDTALVRLKTVTEEFKQPMLTVII
jgi:hypothetical protein